MNLAHAISMTQPRTPKDSDLSFWERLQLASEFSGDPCTPSDIAKELRIQRSAVTKYVQGGFPNSTKLNALAKRRGIRSEWLRSGLGEMLAEEALDPETLELLKIFKELDEDARKRLLANARYERTTADSLTTGRRKIHTEDILRLLRERNKN